MCRQYYTFESFRTSNAVDAYTCSKVAIRYSRAGDPVVALVLPKAARIDIRHFDRLQVLRALEAELGRNTQSYRCTPFRCQRSVFEVDGQDSLRVQCAWHVKARRVAVKALERNIARPQIRTDAAKKDMQRHPAPLTNLAPSFDADVPRGLAFLRQRHQVLKSPGDFIGDPAGYLEEPLRRYGADLPFRIVSIEAEGLGDRARRIGLSQPVGIKQGRLHPVVELQHRPKRRVDAGMSGKIAACQESQGSQRKSAFKKAPATELRQFRRDVAGPHRSAFLAHRPPPRGALSSSDRTGASIETSVRGNNMTSARCMMRKPTIRAIMVKWIVRATG